MTPVSSIHKQNLPGRDNESRLELAYQRVLLNHEKNEKLLMKRIEQLEFNQKNLIIERNMLRTKLCKQTGEMADLSWKVTHYEISSYKNNRWKEMFDREGWALTSKKRVWDFLSSHKIPCKPQIGGKHSNCSTQPVQTAVPNGRISMQSNTINPRRTTSASVMSGRTSSHRTSLAKIDYTSSSQKDRDLDSNMEKDSDHTYQAAICSNLYSDEHTNPLNYALELAREMSSYRCYIRSTIKKMFDKYEPAQRDLDMYQGCPKMRVLPNEIPGKEDEGSMGTLENGLKAISLVTDAAFRNSKMEGIEQEPSPLEFENIDFVACPPEHLVHLNPKVGLLRAIETYQDMLTAFHKVCITLQVLIADVKSTTSLMSASHKENINLHDTLDKVVSTEKIVCTAPEDIIILLNKVLKCPYWINDEVSSMDASVSYPGETIQNKGELNRLRRELSSLEDDKSNLAETIKSLNSQIENFKSVNLALSEKNVRFEESISSANDMHSNELKSKQDEINELKHQYESLSHLHDTYETRLNESSKELSVKNAAIEILNSKLTSFKSKNRQLEIDISNMNDTADKEMALCNQLIIERDRIAAEKEAILKSSAVMETSLKKMLDESKTSLHVVSTEKQTLENNHERCHITIEGLKHSVSEKESELDALKREKNDEIDVVAKRNSFLKQTVENLETQLSDKKCQIAQIFDSNNLLSKEVSKLKQEISDLTEEREKVRSELSKIQLAHKKTLEELKDLAKVNKSQCEEIEQLNLRLAGDSSELSKYETDLKNSSLLISKLESSLSALHSKNGDLEKALLHSTSMSDCTLERCKEAEETLLLKSNEFKKKDQELNSEIKRLKQKISEYQGTCSDLESNYNSVTLLNKRNENDLCNAKKIIYFLASEYRKYLVAMFIVKNRLNAAELDRDRIFQAVTILNEKVSAMKATTNQTVLHLSTLNEKVDMIAKIIVSNKKFVSENRRVNEATKSVTAKVLLKFINVSEIVSKLRQLAFNASNEYKRNRKELLRVISEKDISLEQYKTSTLKFEQELSQFNEEIQNLRAINEKLTSNNAEIVLIKEKSDKDYNDKVNMITNELAEASIKFNELSSKYSECSASLERTKESELAFRTKLELVDTESKRKLNEVSQVISDKELSLENYKKSMIISKQEISRLNIEIENLLTLNEKLTSRNAEIVSNKEKSDTDYKNKIQRVNSELDKTNIRISQLQSKLYDSTAYLDRVRESENALKVKLESMERDKNEIIQNLTNVRKKLESRNAELVRGASEVNEKLQTSNTERDGMERELLKIKNSKISIANDLSELQNKHSSLMESCEELRLNNTSLSNSLSEAVQDKELMFFELEKLKSEIQKLRTHYEDRISKAECELEEANKSLKNYEEMVSTISHKLTANDNQHKEQVKKFESEIARIRTMAQNDNIAISEKLVKTETSLVITEAKIKELTEANEALVSEVILNKQKLEVSDDIIRKYGADIGSKVYDLKAELKAKNDSINKLNEQINTLKAESESFRHSIPTVQNCPEGCKLSQLDHLRNEVATLRFDKCRSIFEVGRLIMEYKERIAELERKLTELSTKGHQVFNIAKKT